MKLNLKKKENNIKIYVLEKAIKQSLLFSLYVIQLHNSFYFSKISDPESKSGNRKFNWKFSGRNILVHLWAPIPKTDEKIDFSMNKYNRKFSNRNILFQLWAPIPKPHENLTFPLTIRFWTINFSWKVTGFHNQSGC